MSLTLLAYAMIVVFMTLIMMKRLSVLTALIVVPIVFALLSGFGPKIGPMMLDGVRAIAPTGVMLMFAILYFGLMIDAGLFDPVVTRVVRLAGGDPVRISVGTALLALFVSLDGDGSTTYLITTAAMLPLYQKLGMSRLMLACTIMMAGGVMNIPALGRTHGARRGGAQGGRGRPVRAADPRHGGGSGLGDLRGVAVRPPRAEAARSPAGRRFAGRACERPDPGGIRPGTGPSADRDCCGLTCC
jgi:hypothetical protein